MNSRYLSSHNSNFNWSLPAKKIPEGTVIIEDQKSKTKERKRRLKKTHKQKGNYHFQIYN